MPLAHPNRRRSYGGLPRSRFMFWQFICMVESVPTCLNRDQSTPRFRPSPCSIVLVENGFHAWISGQLALASFSLNFYPTQFIGRKNNTDSPDDRLNWWELYLQSEEEVACRRTKRSNRKTRRIKEQTTRQLSSNPAKVGLIRPSRSTNFQKQSDDKIDSTLTTKLSL